MDKKNRDLAKQRNRAFIREYKEYHGCSECDEGRAVCLDLHHVDPSTKLFNLSDAEKRSIKAIADEMKKCIVLCANCHRVLHANIEFERKVIELKKEKTLF